MDYPARFTLHPVLATMQALYEMPRTGARFTEYLKHLQGDTKDDMMLPIAGFNPMAKDHLLKKMDELQALGAESILAGVAAELSSQAAASASRTIQIVLNLADDLHGAWTNYYSTDFSSKFELNALVTRNFCTPYFYSSEEYSEAEIRRRAYAYAYRSIYWVRHGKIRSLQDHLAQEVFVARRLGALAAPAPDMDFTPQATLYEAFKEEDDYSLRFNFFYGDAASSSLGYACYGVPEYGGFHYARHLAQKNKKHE